MGGSLRQTESQAYKFATVGFWLASVAAFGSSCSSHLDQGAESEQVASQQIAVSVGEQTIALSGPAGLTPHGAVAIVTNQLSVSDRASLVETDGSPALAANVGTGDTTVGVDARVGSLDAGGSITLRDRAVVNGSLVATGTVSFGNGSVVKGTVEQHQTWPRETVEWRVVWPSVGGGDVMLEPSQIRSISPGAFGNVVVKPSASLSLQSGTYFMSSLDVGPQATLVLDESHGPIFIYLLADFAFKGALSGGSPEKTLLGYLGSRDVFLEQPFLGTLVAPSARVSLRGNNGATHEGAFFAKQLEASPGITVLHRAFDWGFLGLSNFRFADGSVIGNCFNNQRPSSSVQTVCVRSVQSQASLSVLVDGKEAPVSSGCVTVTVGTNTEIRALQIAPDGQLLASDVAFLTTDQNPAHCPINPDVSIGQVGDDVLEGKGLGSPTYVSGGPGDDYLIARDPHDILSGGPGTNVFDLTSLTALPSGSPGLSGLVLLNGPDDVVLTHLSEVEFLRSGISLRDPSVRIFPGIPRTLSTSFPGPGGQGPITRNSVPADPSSIDIVALQGASVSLTHKDPGYIMAVQTDAHFCKDPERQVASIFKGDCPGCTCPDEDPRDGPLHPCSLVAGFFCPAIADRPEQNFAEFVKLDPSGKTQWRARYPQADHNVTAVRELTDARGTIIGYVASGYSGPNVFCPDQQQDEVACTCPPECLSNGCLVADLLKRCTCPLAAAKVAPCPFAATPNRAFLLFLDLAGTPTSIRYFDGSVNGEDPSNLEGNPAAVSRFLDVQEVTLGTTTELLAVGDTTVDAQVELGGDPPAWFQTSGFARKGYAVRVSLNGDFIFARGYLPLDFSATATLRAAAPQLGYAFGGRAVSHSQFSRPMRVDLVQMTTSQNLDPFGQTTFLPSEIILPELVGDPIDGVHGLAFTTRVPEGVGLIASGTRVGIDALDTNAFLARFHSTGEFVSVRAFGQFAGDPRDLGAPSTGVSVGHSVLDFGDGSFGVTGFVRSPYSSDDAVLPAELLPDHTFARHAMLVRTQPISSIHPNFDPVWVQSLGHLPGGKHVFNSEFLSSVVAVDGAIFSVGWSDDCSELPQPQTQETCTHAWVQKVASNGAPPCACNNTVFEPQCGETGKDCGGPCKPCPTTCTDHFKNGTETDVDCGGGHPDTGEMCPPCPTNCHDGVKNGDEQAADCGGTQPGCPACSAKVLGQQLYSSKGCAGCHGSSPKPGDPGDGCGAYGPQIAGATNETCVSMAVLNGRPGMPQMLITNPTEIDELFAYLQSITNCPAGTRPPRCRN
jgi:hypothetical protein